MDRSLKLFINFFLSSIVFTYFVEILILLLNIQIAADILLEEFFLLFIQLYLFYGPMWFLLIFIFFNVIQFFAERKYPIGIFKPHTITYFLSFTILILSFIFYLNYDYYFNFLEGTAKFKFIRVLLINLSMVITGIVFVFFKKKKSKKWMQIVFLVLLAFSIIHGYMAVVSSINIQPPIEEEKESLAINKFFPETFNPRKIRIVLMDGLSLKTIHSMSSDGKLLNFDLLLHNGVSGRIQSFKPNLSLSMLNTAFTGLNPSQYSNRSFQKYKFTDIDYEFDIRPRYIFFRKSPFINTMAFYKRQENQILDRIKTHYQANGRICVDLVNPPKIDFYSEKSLARNNRFLPLFSSLLNEGEKYDAKYSTLKKYFFLDDYLKKLIPNLNNTEIHYAVVSLPGLSVISKNFYQYYIPEIYGTGSKDDAEVKKYGWLIKRYYEYYDSIIGNLMSTTGDNELLVILSFFEYEPLPIWRRILVNLFGQKDFYVYKSLNSQGTIMLYEKNALKRDYVFKTFSIYDIYPTLLYYSGFQLSKELRGDVVRDIFKEQFLLNNPIDINTENRNSVDR